eukprot:COSAG04_NODE_4933_length_1819_cov_1.531395_2_plen_136_part_01
MLLDLLAFAGLVVMQAALPADVLWVMEHPEAVEDEGEAPPSDVSTGSAGSELSSSASSIASEAEPEAEPAEADDVLVAVHLERCAAPSGIRELEPLERNPQLALLRVGGQVGLPHSEPRRRVFFLRGRVDRRSAAR